MTLNDGGGQVETITGTQLEALVGPLSNGNGQADLVAHHDPPTVVAGDNAVITELPALPPGPTCKGCGTDITGRQRAKWCSEKCRHRWEYRKRRGERSGPTSTLDSLTLARLLAIAVPEGMSFSVEVGGVTISACRE